MSDQPLKLNKLTVIYGPFAGKQGRATVRCLCDCGTVKEIDYHKFRTGHTKSCGCRKAEAWAEIITTHGYDGTRLHSIWQGIVRRCKDHPDYGGRGIKLWPDWTDFLVFREWAIANGYSDDLSIERIDVNGNYYPWNCTWIPRRDQSKNTRANNRVTAFGETKIISLWGEDPRCKCSQWTLSSRLRRGWPPEKAISTPPDSRRGRWLKLAPHV